jgi:hypothetical protein
MQKGWLTKTIGGRPIEHIPCPNPGAPVDPDAPPTGVLHTVEGSLESGLAVFRQHYASHFILDAGRIVQLVPLGTMAAALENHPGGVETNAITRAQIEVAGNSLQAPWCCDDPTLDVVADLLATLEHTAEIPLTRPFPDELPPPPWAVYGFARRNAGKWGKVAGWYGHIEVPENEHWDPGAFEWTKVMAKAQKLSRGDGPSPRPKPHPAPPKIPKPIPQWFWTWLQWLLGEGEFAGQGPKDPDVRPADAPLPIPAWAWVKAGQFTHARKEPH